jgi:hypothetical protein
MCQPENRYGSNITYCPVAWREGTVQGSYFINMNGGCCCMVCDLEMLWESVCVGVSACVSEAGMDEKWHESSIEHSISVNHCAHKCCVMQSKNETSFLNVALNNTNLSSTRSSYCAIKTLCKRGAHIFQKSRSYLKILCDRRVTWTQIHTADPKILFATTQCLVARATWHPGIVNPCFVIKGTLRGCRGLFYWWWGGWA